MTVLSRFRQHRVLDGPEPVPTPLVAGMRCDDVAGGWARDPEQGGDVCSGDGLDSGRGLNMWEHGGMLEIRAGDPRSCWRERLELFKSP